eukprot:6979423-Karenia_brevis.AAC.1
MSQQSSRANLAASYYTLRIFAQERPGKPRRAEDSPGKPRRAQEISGELRRAQESQAGLRR